RLETLIIKWKPYTSRCRVVQQYLERWCAGNPTIWERIGGDVVPYSAENATFPLCDPKDYCAFVTDDTKKPGDRKAALWELQMLLNDQKPARKKVALRQVVEHSAAVWACKDLPWMLEIWPNIFRIVLSEAMKTQGPPTNFYWIIDSFINLAKRNEPDTFWNSQHLQSLLTMFIYQGPAFFTTDPEPLKKLAAAWAPRLKYKTFTNEVLHLLKETPDLIAAAAPEVFEMLRAGNTTMLSYISNLAKLAPDECAKNLDYLLRVFQDPINGGTIMGLLRDLGDQRPLAFKPYAKDLVNGLDRMEDYKAFTLAYALKNLAINDVEPFLDVAILEKIRDSAIKLTRNSSVPMDTLGILGAVGCSSKEMADVVMPMLAAALREASKGGGQMADTAAVFAVLQMKAIAETISTDVLTPYIGELEALRN
ncbi:hypothetical protein HK102_010072, partial [Quaeritorhiza haematococci]